MIRRLVIAISVLAGFCMARPAAALLCPLPYNLINGVIYDATQVMADLNALQGCFGSVPGAGGPFDIAMFWPGVPPDSQIVRVAITRGVTCPIGFVNSVAVAREAATVTSVASIDQVSGGIVTARGTVTFPASGTNGIWASAAGITFVAGDLAEFRFAASADSTLGDIAMTLQCVRQ